MSNSFSLLVLFIKLQNYVSYQILIADFFLFATLLEIFKTAQEKCVRQFIYLLFIFLIKILMDGKYYRSETCENEYKHLENCNTQVEHFRVVETYNNIK